MNPEQYAKLRWKCRRGMREMDLVFLDFLDNHYVNAPVEIQQAFEQLIDEQDPIITDYLFERTPTPNEHIDHVIRTMRVSGKSRSQ